MILRRLLQAHSTLGSRLEAEKALTAQMNDQILDGQAAAAKLQRSIADLEQQVRQALLLPPLLLVLLLLLLLLLLVCKDGMRLTHTQVSVAPT